MPSSYSHVIPIICRIIEKEQPERVLDIGFGRGKYGLLTKEYDHALKSIDGIEGEKRYITNFHHALYRRVYNINVMDYIAKSTYKHDMVFFIDVIEHLSKEDGHAVVKHFTDLGSKVVISTPLEDIPQHSEEFPLENHISHWDEPDFERYNYVRHHDDTGKALVLVVERKD